MKPKSYQSRGEKSNKHKSAPRETIESLFIAIGIALVIRAGVVYPFKIPTGSMEGSLLVGDHILCNKFVYGIRTPDWIGIPYTKTGFFIPFFRTPGFRKPQQGDVVIFKYPRDETEYYIKRCIAVSGDTVLIRDKRTFVNGEVFPNPPHSQFIDPRIIPLGIQQQDIYPSGSGNIHNYGPVRIPAPGDTFHFTDSNRKKWFNRLQIILYEGNKITLSYGGQSIGLTAKNQNHWATAIRRYPIDNFDINGESLDNYIYAVKYRQYFMMGDNRDNSLDSRYWGFVPERNVVGEALITYWSWDNEVPLYRLFHKIRWRRLLGLIR